MVAVVLLGAGASFGSGECYPEAPPLGNGLFARLERHSRVAASIPHRIKELFAENFEIGMAEYFRFSDGNIMSFQRELASYFAQFKPGTDNVYTQLIGALGMHRVIYSSLNYDLLFEECSQAMQMNLFYGLHPPGGPAIRFLKPHGSCNFWPQLNGNKLINCSFSGAETDIAAPIEYLNRENTLFRCRNEDSLAPAIAVFDPTKDIRVCKAEMGQQREAWIASVNQAVHVFVVGVRVHQVDEHIWGTLARCPGHVTYYGPTEGDRAEFEDWVRVSGKRNARFEMADFAESVPRMRMRLFGR